ncbi:MAG: YicC/YloC family endoribonuclease [Planctomycetaceae bacterium]
MTGYGEAHRQTGDRRIRAEVRAVNNRYFKFAIRTPDGYAGLEAPAEKLARKYVTRGTVSVSLRVSDAAAAEKYALDVAVLTSYWKQLHDLAAAAHASAPADLGPLLQLPGAVRESDSEVDAQRAWPAVSEVLGEALDGLQEFRRTEGESMRVELIAQCRLIGNELGTIAERAPGVVREYRDRLSERVGELLAQHGAEVSDGDLLREVSLFADRCDITEELTRLRSHLEQFDAVLNQDTSQGRKLEFLSQELFREINTIGSKANDVEIAHGVVEMKAAVEKVREILQNVE